MLAEGDRELTVGLEAPEYQRPGASAREEQNSGLLITPGSSKIITFSQCGKY